MRPTTAFELKSLNSQASRLQLLFEGKPLSISIDGNTIERQWIVSQGFLLVLSDDCPFEESLHFYLLGHQLQLLDAVELSGLYNSGIFRNDQFQGSQCLTFSFGSDDRWELHLLAAPRYRWAPGWFSAVKYRRWLFTKRWLWLVRK